MGHDNLRLFPVEQRRVEDAALHRSRFGTVWIASGRPPRPGNLGSAKGTTASTGVRTSAESATGMGEATKQERAAGPKEPASTAIRDKPGTEEKQKELSSSRSQLGAKQPDGVIRPGLLASPSRVVPPLHIERGIFQPVSQSTRYGHAAQVQELP
jgi:hypothetical protein